MTIPSYVYPIQLNAGEKVKIILSWPGSQDLDLYLIEDGKDLLGYDCVAQEVSPDSNPQIMVYTATKSKIYYPRILLFDGPPIGYSISIAVNGVHRAMYYDSIFQDGFSILSMNLQNTCRVKIIYNGFVSTIELFAPSVSVLSSDYVDSNSNNQNPKFISGQITGVGKSNFVVNHGITYGITSLEKAVVQVWTFSDMKCQHFCSSRKYSSLASGTINTCICFQNFSWNSVLSECVPNCVMIPKATSWDSSTNQCICQAGFAWSNQNGRCEVPCSNIQRAFELFQEQYENCVCQNVDKIIWKTDKKICEIDCSIISWAIQVQPGFINRCICFSGFIWNTSTLLCDQICGDSLSYTFACDNELGIAFDGCSDDCTVMPNFYCQVDILKQTECSFNGEIIFDFVLFQRNGISNQFTYVIRIIEPILNIFLNQTEDETSKMMNLVNSKILVKSSSFNLDNFELTFQADFFQDLINETFFNIRFDQKLIQPKMFKSEVNFHSFYRPIFFEPNDYKISNLIYYCCWVIAIFSWICFCLSICLRKLYGVEVLIMVQLCWVSLIWNQSCFTLIFNAVYPLKYVTEMNLSFFVDKSETLFQRLPYLDLYSISRYNFFNNFNISSIIIFIPLIAVIVCYLILFKSIWLFKKYDKIIWKWSIKEETTLSPTIQKNFFFYRYSLQLLMYGCLASLVYLTQCTSLYYLMGDFELMVNHVMIGLCIFIILMTFGKFFLSPDYFECFIYSFKQGKICSKFIFFHVITLISIVLLMTLIKQKFAVLIPCGVMLLSIILLRPYEKTIQNFCCFLNYLVISSFFAFHFLLEYFPHIIKQNRFFLSIYLMIIVCGLLPLAIFISNFCLIYDYFTDEKILVIFRQFEKGRITKQMIQQMVARSVETSDVNKKIKYQKRQSIFSKVLPIGKTIKKSSLSINYDDDGQKQLFNFKKQSGIKLNIQRVCGNNQTRQQIISKLKQVRQELKLFPILKKKSNQDRNDDSYGVYLNQLAELDKQIGENLDHEKKVHGKKVYDKEQAGERHKNVPKIDSQLVQVEYLETTVKNVIQCEDRFIGLNGVLQKIEREQKRHEFLDKALLLNIYDNIH